MYNSVVKFVNNGVEVPALVVHAAEHDGEKHLTLVHLQSEEPNTTGEAQRQAVKMVHGVKPLTADRVVGYRTDVVVETIRKATDEECAFLSGPGQTQPRPEDDLTADDAASLAAISGSGGLAGKLPSAEDLDNAVAEQNAADATSGVNEDAGGPPDPNASPVAVPNEGQIEA